MAQQEQWQFSGQGPKSYEQHMVPALFMPCASSLVARSALQAGERVLDAACGTGIVARLAATQVGERGHVIGLDLNPDMISVAQALPSPKGAPIVWQEGSVEALPFEDGIFDVVLCQQGLQFCPNRGGALREMHRVLRPGGRFLCSVWRDLSHGPYFTAVVQAVTEHVSPDAGRRMRAPYALGDREELRSLVRAAGFHDVRITIDILPMHVSSLEQFLPGQFAASPVAADVAAMDSKARERFFTQIATSLEPHRDDEGYAIPLQIHIARANATGADA